MINNIKVALKASKAPIHLHQLLISQCLYIYNDINNTSSDMSVDYDFMPDMHSFGTMCDISLVNLIIKHMTEVTCKILNILKSPTYVCDNIEHCDRVRITYNENTALVYYISLTDEAFNFALDGCNTFYTASRRLK